MGERAEALARRFELSTRAIVAAVQHCPEADWQRPSTNEAWSMAATVHYLASNYVSYGDVVQMVANGEFPERAQWHLPAQVGGPSADTRTPCRKEEGIESLRCAGVRVASLIRSLSDEQLDRTVPTPFLGGVPMSTQDLINLLLVGHSMGCLAGIREALAADRRLVSADRVRWKGMGSPAH